ncbi:MAG: TIR domain-containing protein [Acidimicrobiia bacterium]
MSTAEAGTGASDSPVAVVYDGFLSYSHAADDLLAPRLQAGLQRFAKPWWKRRALRVFRDDASLSANPHLWSSITEALDQSGWFVLLLSPDAAESPWVNREVEYWLQHKEASRVLPVVTDGEFGWAGGDVSPETDSTPPALYGAFGEEPRWVDLRWARTDTDLDLSNAEFRNAVADIASALRGMPKDELASEEVKQHRRTIRTAWAAGVALLLLVVVATAAAVFAISQRNEAQENERLARTRELASAADFNISLDPERSVLLALAAVDASRSVDGLVLREAEEALHRSVQASRVVYSLPASGAVAFSPDGRLLVTPGISSSSSEASGQAETVTVIAGSSTVIVWDVTSGQVLGTLEGHEGLVTNLTFSPDGSHVATSSSDRTARVWNVSTGEELMRFVGHEDGLISVAFSPDGRLLATTGMDEAARIWDVQSGDELAALENPFASGLAFSPDGTVLAVAGGDLKLWDVASAELVRTLSGHQFELSDVVFSKDGSMLVTSSQDATAKLWDPETGEEFSTLIGHTGPLLGVDINSDGTLIVTSGSDASVRVWERGPSSVREVMSLVGHEGPIPNVALSPDSSLLASGSEDGSVRVWDLSVNGSREQLTVPGASVWVGAVAFAPDGTWIVASADDGVAVGWNVDTGDELFRLVGHEGQSTETGAVFAVDVSTDGTIVATASNDRTVKLWDASTGRERLTFSNHDGWVNGVSISADGATVASVADDGTARLWEAETGNELVAIAAHPGNVVFGVEFSPGGSLIATVGTDSRAVIWDAQTGLAQIDWTVPRPFSVAFDPLGERVVTAGDDGSVTVWDATSGEEILSIQAHSGGVLHATFSPDGSQLASGGFDGAVRLWDSATGLQLLELGGHTSLVARVAFSPNGELLASISDDGTVRIYVLPVERLIELAKSRLTRWWTPQECLQYLHTDGCPPPNTD